MRKFRFRLDSVLRYRRRIEEARQTAFVHAHRKRLVAEALAMEMERRRHELSLCEYGADLEGRQRRDVRLLHLDDRIATQRQLVDLLVRDEDLAREEWLKARRDVKALEELRDRAWRRYEAEAIREEQWELDEWTILTRSAPRGRRPTW